MGKETQPDLVAEAGARADALFLATLDWRKLKPMEPAACQSEDDFEAELDAWTKELGRRKTLAIADMVGRER